MVASSAAGRNVPTSAHAIVDGAVRELVRRRGIDPIVEPGVVARLVDEVVGDYRDRSITAALPPLGDAVAATRAVLDAVAGFGPLQPLLDDPTIEEIWINEPGRVFVARHGRSELTTVILSGEQVADPTDDRAHFDWIVHAPQGGTVYLLARHQRAGVVRAEVQLG